jgi:hypothetical protein
MQFDPSKGTPLSSSASTSLKRSLAQQSTASARKTPRVEGTETPASLYSSSSRRGSSVFSPEFEMPTPSSSASQLSSNSMSRGGSLGQRTTRAVPAAFKGTKNKGRSKSNAGPRTTVFEGPLHDRNYIIAQYDQEYSDIAPPKPIHVQNPKSSLSNFQHTVFGTLPQYDFAEGSVKGREIWRYIFSHLFSHLRPTIVQMHSNCTNNT